MSGIDGAKGPALSYLTTEQEMYVLDAGAAACGTLAHSWRTE